MSVTPNYVPRHFKTINVLLKVNDAERALRFYNNGFGAEVVEKLVDSEGVIKYAEIQIEDTILMITEDKNVGSISGIVLQIYTGDAEGLYEAVVMAGAEELTPITKQFYGDRLGTVRDPFGIEWAIATHMEDVPPNELKRRFDELSS